MTSLDRIGIGDTAESGHMNGGDEARIRMNSPTFDGAARAIYLIRKVLPSTTGYEFGQPGVFRLTVRQSHLGSSE